MARLRWRNKPLPALRLTDSGIDYSAAYTGAFTLHVQWSVPAQEHHPAAHVLVTSGCRKYARPASTASLVSRAIG